MTDSLASRLAGVRQRIEQACRRVDRDPATVRLVAVSKTVPAETLAALHELGHDLVGENRVQEALAKQDRLAGRALHWHFIGRLQRNKVRQVVGRFDLVHGVDGPKLAEEIEARASARSIAQPVLIQVNQAGEATKGGVAPAGLADCARLVESLGHVDLRGLMAIPPPVDDPEESRAHFRELRRLRDRLAQQIGRPLDELSMGMTHDFEVAVEEGATLVRVGRGLFGERRSARSPLQ